MDDDPRRSKYLLSLRRTSNDVLKMFPAGHTDIGSSPIGDTQRHKDKDTKTKTQRQRHKEDADHDRSILIGSCYSQV